MKLTVSFAFKPSSAFPKQLPKDRFAFGLIALTLGFALPGGCLRTAGGHSSRSSPGTGELPPSATPRRPAAPLGSYAKPPCTYPPHAIALSIACFHFLDIGVDEDCITLACHSPAR